MIEISLEQGSKEWHEFRRMHIGASDAPAIMEVSPFQGIVDLWEQKTGLRQPKQTNDAMRRGTALEPIARKWYIEQTNVDMSPIVAIHSDIPYMMASLDGISQDRKQAIEIKCNGKTTHENVRLGYIPEHHYAQLQHICCVCDLSMVDYVSFDGEQGIIVQVKRDDTYIERLIQAEHNFWYCVTNFVSPLLMPLHRKYQTIDEEDEEKWKTLYQSNMIYSQT